MSLKKTIDVNRAVLSRKREPVQEPKTTPDGRIFVVGSDIPKRQDQLKSDDELLLVDIPIGRLFTMALDKTEDKLSPEERRKRFTLSARVEDAMLDGTLFEMDPDDRKRIEAAAELITHSHLFLYRIHEALETAEPVRVRVKANGASVEEDAHVAA